MLRGVVRGGGRWVSGRGGWDGVPKAWIVSGMESNWEAGI